MSNQEAIAILGELKKCYLGGVVDALDFAIEAVKAQEPVEPKIVDTSNSKLYHNDMFKNHYCGNCGEFLHVVNRKDLFCSQCGMAVKWK